MRILSLFPPVNNLIYPSLLTSNTAVPLAELCPIFAKLALLTLILDFTKGSLSIYSISIFCSYYFQPNDFDNVIFNKNKKPQ